MDRIIPLAVHQTRRFAKRLTAMAKAGKHERIAAERARKIIAGLQTHPLHEETECKRTRHGELRLNDCRKYDLSCGYRLIALKRDQRLIFTYIGSHDDCQHWIENNREHQDVVISTPVPSMQTLLIGGTTADHSEPEVPDTDEYEERIQAEIDEQVLRALFPGFCKPPEQNF